MHLWGMSRAKWINNRQLGYWWAELLPLTEHCGHPNTAASSLLFLSAWWVQQKELIFCACNGYYKNIPPDFRISHQKYDAISQDIIIPELTSENRYSSLWWTQNCKPSIPYILDNMLDTHNISRSGIEIFLKRFELSSM